MDAFPSESLNAPGVKPIRDYRYLSYTHQRFAIPSVFRRCHRIQQKTGCHFSGTAGSLLLWGFSSSDPAFSKTAGMLPYIFSLPAFENSNGSNGCSTARRNGSFPLFYRCF